MLIIAPRARLADHLRMITRPSAHLALATLMAALVAAACSLPTSSSGAPGVTSSAPASGVPSAAPATSSAPASPQAADWSYDGDSGPAHWAELDPAFHACADGKMQSPIDISTPDEKRGPDPVFDYVAGDATIVNDGHTILAVPTEENTITIRDTVYVDDNTTNVRDTVSTLVRLEFHVPAEHTVGNQAPGAAEMQFVHQDASGAFTIVGVTVVEGTNDSAAWAPYVDAMTTPQGTDRSATIDWPKLLPSDLVAWYYNGSLTTPPCTEGVHWIFLTEPISLSAAQIAKLRAAYDGNARPIQPFGDYRALTIDLKGD
jgi:carbonic anhydrase